MATFLDISLLQSFDIIFPFLLVAALSYGFLSFSKVFGDNHVVQGVISFVLGMMVLFSPMALQIINTMAPWFIIVFVFFLFMIMTYKLFGPEVNVAAWVQSSAAFYLILTIVLIIGIGSVTSVVFKEGGLSTGTTGTEGTPSAFWSTLFHPKVLGLALILLIAVFTIQQLSKVAK